MAPKSRARPAAPARRPVEKLRVKGTLASWEGTFGWIEPCFALDHPAADKNGGMLYLAQADIEEDLGPEGSAVSFSVYTDANGLGAMEVRSDAASGGKASARAPPAPSRSAYLRYGMSPREGNAYGKAPSAAYGSGSKAPTSAYGNAKTTPFNAYASAKTAPFKPKEYGQAHSGSGQAYGSSGAAYGKQYGKSSAKGKASQGAPRQQMTQEQLANAVHSSLTEALWPCVEEVAHLEETWSAQEMSKRVVRYMYKSSMSEDLTKLDWRQAVQRFVDRATVAYVSACAEKPWFLELNVTPALGAASWTIVQACGENPRPKKKDVEGLTAGLFELNVHKTKFDKALWEAVQEYFPIDEKGVTKFYNAFSRSYANAFETALKASNGGDYSQCEEFMKVWINEGLTRAWHGVENSPDVFTPESIADFFRNLTAMTLEDAEISCIPPPLMPEGERSPEEWLDYLLPMVQDLFTAWENPEPTAGSKKRKHEANEDDYGDDDEPEE